MNRWIGLADAWHFELLFFVALGLLRMASQLAFTRSHMEAVPNRSIP